MAKESMRFCVVEYTDDLGEMDGMGEPIKDFLPTPEAFKNAPIHIFQTLPNGTEQTICYRYPGTIHAVRLEKPHEVTLEFADGRTITAHLAENFQLVNHLKE